MLKKVLISTLSLAVISGLALFVGCKTEAQTGTAIGALAGAGIGQLAGGDTESTLIGAAIGAGAGYIIGNEADKKKSTQNEPNSTGTQIVNVTNSNGSVTPVRLTRQGSYYIGPKGERYTTLPTQEQLKSAYGF